MPVRQCGKAPRADAEHTPSRGQQPTTSTSRGHSTHLLLLLLLQGDTHQLSLLLLQGDTPCTHTNFFHFYAMGHAPNFLYVYNPTYSHLATVVVSLIISSFAQPQLHIHQSLFLESTNAHLPILSPILKGK